MAIPERKLTPKEAEAEGMKPLTTPYSLPGERWMVDNVLRDLRRSRIECATVVRRTGSCEIWRKPNNVSFRATGFHNIALEAR